MGDGTAALPGNPNIYSPVLNKTAHLQVDIKLHTPHAPSCRVVFDKEKIISER